MSQEFDLPIYSGRQLWHYCTYSMSCSGLEERVDSSPMRKFPGYEKGILAAINTLRDDVDRHHLWVFGSLCWDAYVEGSDSERWKYAAQTVEFLQLRLSFQDKPDKWKERAHNLARFAVWEVRHRNPPDMSESRPALFTTIILSKAAGVADPGNFRRDAGEPWDYLCNELESWVGKALEPLAKWIESKEAA